MDELIRTPEEPIVGGLGTEGSMGLPTRVMAIGVLILSGLILAGTAMVDAFFPKEMGQPIGQEARDLAEAKRNRNLWDGSLAKGFETRLRIRSRVRQTLAPYWSAVLFKKLGVVPPDLVAGKEGWLFLRSRVQTHAASRGKAISATGVATAAIGRRLGVFGSELIVIPIPRKAAACVSMLPTGLDPDLAFESDLIRELRSRGQNTINSQEFWEPLPPLDRYLRQDSHWANPGLRALADAIAKTHPELLAQEVEASIREWPTPAPAALLGLAAIPQNHVVRPWVTGDKSAWLYVVPRKISARLGDRSTDFDVAIVGSSFTKSFSFAEILTAKLGRLVYPGGQAGTPFGGSLAKFAAVFDGRPFPQHVLFEFPVHQAIRIGEGRRAVRRSLGSFFVGTSNFVTHPVPIELLSKPHVSERIGGDLRLTFDPGVLLSTGDGVLQLRLRISTDVESQWEFRSTGPSMEWTQAPGVREMVLPVLQGEAIGERVLLMDLGGIGAGANVEVEVVTDVDLGRAEELHLEVKSSSAFLCSLQKKRSDRNGALVVQWSGRPQAVRIQIDGMDREGNARKVEAIFIEPLSRIALLSLTPFNGGFVGTIRIEGDLESPVVSIASQ